MWLFILEDGLIHSESDDDYLISNLKLIFDEICRPWRNMGKPVREEGEAWANKVGRSGEE